MFNRIFEWIESRRKPIYEVKLKDGQYTTYCFEGKSWRRTTEVSHFDIDSIGLLSTSVFAKGKNMFQLSQSEERYGACKNADIVERSFSEIARIAREQGAHALLFTNGNYVLLRINNREKLESIRKRAKRV